MKNNAEVKAFFEEAQQTLENLATAQAVAPPEDLKDKIWLKIQKEQLPDELPIEPTEIASKTAISIPAKKTAIEGNGPWKVLGIAASLLLLFSVGANLFWMNNRQKIEAEIAALKSEKQNQQIALNKIQQKLDLFANPNLQLVNLKGVEKHPDTKATVFWDKNSKDNLPQVPTGTQYQLWAIVAGKPVSAGMYTAEKDSKIALSHIVKAQAFAITLEKEGGSNTPTMENMFVMGEV